jgi:hypothetical protein
MPLPSRPIPDLAREVTPQEIERLFAGAHFPSYRKQLVDYARDRFATADLLAILDSLPERVYHSAGEIMTAVHGLAMQRGD